MKILRSFENRAPGPACTGLSHWKVNIVIILQFYYYYFATVTVQTVLTTRNAFRSIHSWHADVADGVIHIVVGRCWQSVAHRRGRRQIARSIRPSWGIRHTPAWHHRRWQRPDCVSVTTNWRHRVNVLQRQSSNICAYHPNGYVNSRHILPLLIWSYIYIIHTFILYRQRCNFRGGNGHRL